MGRKKDPAAVAMANRRWEKQTEAQKRAFGRRLTDARLKLRKERAKKRSLKKK